MVKTTHHNTTGLSGQIIDAIKLLTPFVRPYGLLFSGALLATVVALLSQRAIPYALGQLIDLSLVPKNEAAYVFWGTALAIFYITSSASRFFSFWLFTRLGNKSVHDLRHALFDHVLRLGLNFFNKNPTGRIVNRLTYDPSQIQEIFSEGLINIFIQLTTIILIVVSMALISWKLTFLVLIPVPLFIYFSFLIIQRLRLVQKQSKEQLGLLSSLATEKIAGAKVIHALGAYELVFQGFKKASDLYRDLNLKMIATSALMHPVLNLAAAFVVGGLLFLSPLGQQEGLSLGLIVALVLHGNDLISPLREILERYQQFQNSLTSAERITPIFKEKKEQLEFTETWAKITNGETSQTDKPKHIEISAIHTPGPHNAIEIKDLYFRYQDNSPWILEGINLDIRKGEALALVGATGSGKSTLIKLIQGFITPQKGQIYVLGRPIATYTLREIRAQLGVILQDPFIFRGTLRDNLIFFKPLTDEAIQSRLQATPMWDYFKSKGIHLNFNITEHGNNLSQGEKQLLSFARLWLLDPPIFILDEATSHVDSATEVLIQEAFYRLCEDRTAIVIAHRLSTLKKCHRIMILQGGKLKGTSLDQVPSDLIAAKIAQNNSPFKSNL